MFTWVCQRCGKEVDVAEVECPHCAMEAERTALGSAHGAARGPLEEEVAPQRLPPPQRTMSAPAAVPAPAPEPAHVFAIRPLHLALFGLALLVSLGGAIYLARPDLMTVEGVSLPKLPSLGAAEVQPLQQGPIEVSGIRAWRDEQSKLRIRAVLVNHTAGPHPALHYRVLLRDPAAEQKAPPAATFEVHLDEPLGGRESREIETELLAPDGLTALPDWNRIQVAIEEIPGDPAEQ